MNPSNSKQRVAFGKGKGTRRRQLAAARAKQVRQPTQGPDSSDTDSDDTII